MSQKERPQRPNTDQQQNMTKYDHVFSQVQGHVVQQASQDSRNQSTSKELQQIKGTVVLAQPPSYKHRNPITIGEALEATVLTAGKKKVDRSDAAAIQAAEVRATGRTNVMPGGLAATAQSAAQINARTTNKDEKTTLADVLTAATSKLPKDRPVIRQDAEGVVGAELRNNPNISTYPGGVAASVVAAARINQSYTEQQLGK